MYNSQNSFGKIETIWQEKKYKAKFYWKSKLLHYYYSSIFFFWKKCSPLFSFYKCINSSFMWGQPGICSSNHLKMRHLMTYNRKMWECKQRINSESTQSQPRVSPQSTPSQPRAWGCQGFAWGLLGLAQDCLRIVVDWR